MRYKQLGWGLRSRIQVNMTNLSISSVVAVTVVCVTVSSWVNWIPMTRVIIANWTRHLQYTTSEHFNNQQQQSEKAKLQQHYIQSILPHSLWQWNTKLDSYKKKLNIKCMKPRSRITCRKAWSPSRSVPIGRREKTLQRFNLFHIT